MKLKTTDEWTKNKNKDESGKYSVKYKYPELWTPTGKGSKKLGTKTARRKAAQDRVLSVKNYWGWWVVLD